MTESLKLLGRADLTTSQATLYTVPGSTEAVISVRLTNYHATASATYRLGITDAGSATTAAGDFIAYDTPLEPGEVHVHDGIALDAGKIVRVRASAASSINASAYGVEVT